MKHQFKFQARAFGHADLSLFLALSFCIYLLAMALCCMQLRRVEISAFKLLEISLSTVVCVVSDLLFLRPVRLLVALLLSR